MISRNAGYNIWKGGGIFTRLKSKKHVKGYTLTEIVLVLAFLGIIISGVFPVFINSIEANKSAEYYSKAYKILDSKIEEYRNSDFNSLTDTEFDIAELPSGHGVLTVEENVEGAPQNDIREVELTVSWNFKRDREVKIATYIARGGIKK